MSEFRGIPNALAALIHEVHAQPARDLDGGWQTVVEHLQQALGAHYAYSVLAVRDPSFVGLGGWAPMQVFQHGIAPRLAARVDGLVSETKSFSGDPATLALVKGAGAHRAHRTFDLVPRQAPESHLAQRYLELVGSHDQLVGAHTVNPEVEVYFGFHHPSRKFSVPEVAMLREVLPLLHRPCRWFALAYGALPQRSPTTPRERDVVSALLAGVSEKVIAENLGLTPGSTHQVVVRVFRKYGVRSRSELMALWLGE